MKKSLLVELTGQSQIDKVLSSLQEIVESGLSVFFSFPAPGRVTVLLTSPPSRTGLTERHIDRNFNQKSFESSGKEEDIGREVTKS